MALLQIAEPGQSTAPHQHRLVVGIDLGTTNSLVATHRNGETLVLPDEAGAFLLPSVVHFGASGQTTVGQAAQQLRANDPLNTIASAKRLIGRAWADVQQQALPYVLEQLGDTVAVRTAAGVKTPVEVGAEVLRVLRQRAQAWLGGDITGAVITVPAYFDDAQRQATKEAARLAGLPVLRLLNEPTAAAVAYGLDQAEEGRYVVYDLGGGTFDVSLLHLQKGVFEVLGTGGDSALGGDDFDHRLVEWFTQQHARVDWSGADLSALHSAARSTKEALTRDDNTSMVCVHHLGGTCSTTVSRAQFELLTRDLLQRTLSATKRVLRDARLTVDDIDGVVLVGGSTRMPMVREAVAQMFGQPPLCRLDPDQAVALGAARQADQLAGNRSGADDVLLLDVCPLSLGIETMGGLVEKIIPRNSTLPTARAQDFTTFKDGQTAISLHVVQGERELVDQCRSLARFTLRGIPPMTAGAARVRVTFQIDTDGLLSVSALEQTSGVSAHVEVKPAHGLSQDQIADMLRGSFGHAEEDATLRGLREAQVDARRLLDATEAALTQDQALLSPDEAQDIRRTMQLLYEQLEQLAEHGEGNSPDERRQLRETLRGQTDLLNRVTTPFAARRMDTRVRQALNGQRLEQVA